MVEILLWEHYDAQPMLVPRETVAPDVITASAKHADGSGSVLGGTTVMLTAEDSFSNTHKYI